jgi:tetratricopeptide (TPR) repeat protein
MGSTNRLHTIAGWLVFAIALTVYFFSAERTGSLWDCGEFILGAYKLQVVHPPGAPFFILVGRLFTWFAELFSDNPADIAFAVNLMSGISTAFAAAFVAWTTIILGKMALVGREGTPDSGQNIALAGAGIVAGLTTAFATSIWFSAVEGEVYAMSTFFTTLTLWSMMKWYNLPDTPSADRWLLFTVYAAGLSTGVHLLSLLTFPALALFYYFKKYNEYTWKGIAIAAAVGVAIIVAVQNFVIVGIPGLWSTFDLMMVNGLGLPFHSGIIPTFIVVAAIIVLLLMYVHGKITSPVPMYVLAGVFLLIGLYAENSMGGGRFIRMVARAAVIGALGFFMSSLLNRYRREMQLFAIGAALVIVAFSTIGLVVIRANAGPPINMNAPTDAMRLLPYLNREQYGERALLHGPHFDARPMKTEIEERYGRKGDRYEIVDQKISYVYRDQDKMLFPRMGDYSQGRPRLYKQWVGMDPSKPLPPGRPNQADNISFLVNYQLGWMYWRYFMWNFSGRQNGEQGFYPWDKSAGHWISGIKFLDEARLGNQDKLPEAEKNAEGRNTYYMLPFLFGLVGLFFHFRKRPNEATGLLALFIITGIGIIIYSNQPPNEPRERDYVLVGSFFTYAIWIGMSVLALYELLKERIKLAGPASAAVAAAVILIAPALMGTQNFDDHSRIHHSGARDYANNFLQSVEENAIIFTYGDNDTYPLWYAQEVEGIRTDVRVVNLSLIAVDWYIDLLRRKVNDSPPIKMTIPSEALRGNMRNQVFYYNTSGQDRPKTLQNFLEFIGSDHPITLPFSSGAREVESYYDTKQVYIPVNKQDVLAKGVVSEKDTANIVDAIPLNLQSKDYMIKDELAILDVIGSNLWDRPIYFAVTARQEKLFGLDDYMQLEGLALRVVPVKSNSEQQYGIIGSGRVDGGKVYENVMNDFMWGNFDQKALFVDRSYAPSVQSHQLSMRRAALQLQRDGETEKAIELIDKYFEVFPDMNFPYDYRAYYMISVYLEAGAYEKAKPHLQILAERTADELDYYNSLDPEILESSFQTEYMLAMRTMDDIVQAARQNNDEAFAQELQRLFEPFQMEMPENMMQQRNGGR